MSPRFTIRGFEFHVRKTRTRFPFRYGIASMTEVPHLFVSVRIALDGAEQLGVASEGLPPKWFTKNPNTTFEQDLPDMLRVIGHAAHTASHVGLEPVSFFDLWREINAAQSNWAKKQHFPELLAHLGVSLIERAILDAFCRAMREPFHLVVNRNLLGLRLGQIYPELGSAEPGNLLPAQPTDSMLARHTVGLADPLTSGDIAAGDQVNDGLPHDLESCIRAYRLSAFKIKVWGRIEQDAPRLRALSAILEQHCPAGYIVTLDGNENFKDFDAFRDFWNHVIADRSLQALCDHVSIIEQPVHRDHALSPKVRPVLDDWHDHPPLIIDESDGAPEDLTQALGLGYAGVSHKNCKGIVKGIAHACLLKHRSRHGKTFELTAEDLCNLGPIAMLQDLAVVASLGIPHVERNGHHYFRGLSMWPEEWQQQILSAHPDVYTRHEAGFARLHISGGRLQLGSVNSAPLGVAPQLDPFRFENINLPV